jgi:hypothetical protein
VAEHVGVPVSEQAHPAGARQARPALRELPGILAGDFDLLDLARDPLEPGAQLAQPEPGPARHVMVRRRAEGAQIAPRKLAEGLLAVVLFELPEPVADEDQPGPLALVGPEAGDPLDRRQ